MAKPAKTNRAPSTPANRIAHGWSLGFAWPEFAGSSAKRGFLVLIGILVIASFVLPIVTRGLVFLRQKRLPENQIWNAVEALDRDDLESAREYVDRAIETTITEELEGNALYYLAPYYHELATKVSARGWDGEVRALEYKALRHYHRVRRHLEYLPPWIELERQYAKTDFAKFLQIFELVCSHSLASNREIQSAFARDEWSNLMDYAMVRDAYYNREPKDVKFETLQRRKAIHDPAFWINAGIMEVRTLIKLGQKQAAVAKAQSLAREYQGRLECGALAAEAANGTGALRFSDFLKNYKQWTVLDFQNLQPAATEYHEPRPIDIGERGVAWMRAIGAGELELQVPRPVKNVYLAASGTQFLGIFPMVLVSVDGGEPFPLYIDHPVPTIYSLDLALEPGEHRIRFEFLNDARVDMRGVIHDRDVGLMRLVLAHDGEP